jgi:hypothetical protein
MSEHEPGGAADQARRRNRRAAGAAAAVVLAALVAAMGWLGWDDVRSHQAAADQARRAADLRQQLADSRDLSRRLDAQVAEAHAENQRLQQDANNPTLAMWNSCGGPCTVSANAVRVGSVPDTFQLQISFTSDVPIHAYVLTFHQWTQFDSCGFSLRCVTGSYRAYDAATSLNQTFDEAEGCSGYVWVLQAERDGTIHPDVKVRYQPADHPTGVCAQSP